MKTRVPSVFPLLRPLVAFLLLLAVSGCTVYQSIGKSVGSFLHPVSGGPIPSGLQMRSKPQVST